MDIKFIKKLIEDNQLRTKEATGAVSSMDSAPEKQTKKPAGKQDTTPDSQSSNPGQADLPPFKGSKTMSGQQSNKVEVQPGIYPPEIKEGRTAVVAFGRFNPPTVGHHQLVQIVEHLAKESRGTAMVFLSRTEGTKKDPLVYESKLAYAQYAFGETIHHTPTDANDVLKIATHVCEQGFDNLIFVAGSDRFAEFNRKLNMYNGDLYEFKNIIVESSGERNPDSEDYVANASASALREHAAAGDFASFFASLAKPLRPLAEQIYAEVRGELNELNTQQRAKRAIIFRRNKARIKVGRDRAVRTRAAGKRLMKRSRRLAIKNMRKRILRGTNYADLSYAQRATVDQRLKKRKKSIGKLAKRLLPKVARAEASRKLGGRFTDPMKGKTVNESIQDLISFIPEAEYDYELTPKEVESLKEKADKFGYSYEILETVFRRGIKLWENIEIDMTFSQYGFGRVNSFLNEGKAYDMDFDLVVEDCEEYASTTDDEEDANSDGKIDRSERGAIDLRPAERAISTGVNFHRHERNSVNHRSPAQPGKTKHHQLMKKVFEQLSGEVPNLGDGMNKRRVDLPQLTNFDAFDKDMSDSGHSLGHDYVKPDSLTPTQKHFNQEKVDKLKEKGWDTKPIIVSDDNFVIDGHHRWLAAHQLGEKIKVRRTSLKADDLLDFCKNKPYVETKKLSENKE